VQKILISACFLGERVRHDGGHALVQHPLIWQWIAERRLVPVCPETLGALPTPRPCAEISQQAPPRILTSEGRDVTRAFKRGSALTARTARAHHIRLAILKDGSPSCGTSRVHDGSFSGRTVAGRGVAAALLVARGIRVFSEVEIEQAAAYLEQLEREPPHR
jgi:uncharacterized protein YbbK (DUF523 family)